MLVCKRWLLITTEFLYHTVVIREPNRLRWLKQSIERRPDVARWIRRIFIYEDDRYNKQSISSDCVEDELVSILQHCKRLQMLSIQQYILNSTSLTLIDTLANHCSESLIALNLRVSQMTPIEFISTTNETNECATDPTQTSSSADSTANASAAAKFPKLRGLSMRGFCLDLLGCAMTWSIPSLTHLTIDFENCHIDRKAGVSSILGSFGPQLTTLNVNAASINFDFHEILSLCPKLENVSFDLAHWKPTFSHGPSGSGTRSISLSQYSSLKTLGLHGLLRYLGIEMSWEYGISTSAEMHDTNFNLLLERRHFPNLQTIRLLNPIVTEKVSERHAPRPVYARERLKKWERQCKEHGVQIEDCTGTQL